MDILSFLLGRITADGSGGGGGSEAVLIDKNISANGTYNASSDDADGYKKVVVDVPVPTLGTKIITQNGLYDASDDGYGGYSELDVDVPNTYTAADEGKVVSNGSLVSQSSQNITENGTYDTTLKNQVVVNVPSPVFSGNDFIDRYFNTSDFESDKVFNLPDIKFGGLFKARSIRLLNATGGNMYGMQYFLNVAALVNYLVLPGASDISVDFVKNVTSILGVDFGTNLGTIRATAFSGATSFDKLVIRKSTGVPTLSNINAFSNSCFADGKTGGTLYVPNDMISDFQSASNWSTILGYANNQIKSIESTHTDPTAPVDLTTHFIDGTLIPT